MSQPKALFAASRDEDARAHAVVAWPGKRSVCSWQCMWAGTQMALQGVVRQACRCQSWWVWAGQPPNCNMAWKGSNGQPAVGNVWGSAVVGVGQGSGKRGEGTNVVKMCNNPGMSAAVPVCPVVTNHVSQISAGVCSPVLVQAVCWAQCKVDQGAGMCSGSGGCWAGHGEGCWGVYKGVMEWTMGMGPQSSQW